MADAGRRPKAASIAVLEGYRKDRINDSAPKGDGELPLSPPEWVDGFDSSLFADRLASLEAIDTSTLKDKDLANYLARLDDLDARIRTADTARTFWEEYAPLVNALGITAYVDTPKFAMAALAVARVLCGVGRATDIAQARAALSEFAMDPLTRQKFVTPDAGSADPMAQMLKARGL